MTRYVAGFLFSEDRDWVTLIQKTHGPDCMIGKWNAVGGKRRPGEPGLPDESSDGAMFREFMEEAGVAVSWTIFLRLKGRDWEVDFYHAFSDDAINRVTTCEEEIVSVFPLSSLPKTVPNLRWIIPMALGHEDDHVWVYEVIEKETFAPLALRPRNNPHEPLSERAQTEMQQEVDREYQRFVSTAARNRNKQ